MRSIKDYAWTAFFAVAVAFGAWLSWAATKHRVYNAEQATAAAQGEAKGLRIQVEAFRAADAVRETERKRVANQSKENHDKLDRALEKAPDWADAGVPPGVADSLRDAARKANIRPTGPGAVQPARGGASAAAGRADKQRPDKVGAATDRSPGAR